MPKNRSIATHALASAALLFALSQPVGAAAADTGPVSPIAVADGCSYKTMSSGFGFGGAVTINGKGYNFFNVSFTNNATTAADRIVFQIDFGKSSRIVIPSAGTFAPGQTVKQTFRDKGKEMVFSERPTPNDGSVICTVLSAHFVDGTEWMSPSAPMPSPTP